MKEKLYIQYENDLPGYWIIMSQNPLVGDLVLLDLLFDALNAFNSFIIIDFDEHDHNIITLRLQLPGDTEDEYGSDGILKMSKKNYDYIMQKWQQVLQHRPKYFILSRDDQGWIDLEMKNELSSEDQKYLDQDKIKKLQS